MTDDLDIANRAFHDACELIRAEAAKLPRGNAVRENAINVAKAVSDMAKYGISHLTVTAIAKAEQLLLLGKKMLQLEADGDQGGARVIYKQIQELTKDGTG